MKRHNFLVADKEKRFLDFIESNFGGEYRVFSAIIPEEALKIMEQENISLIMFDIHLEDMMKFLNEMITGFPETIKIILSDYYSVDQMFPNLINTGKIYQCLPKDRSLYEFKLAIRRALEKYDASLELQNKSEEISRLQQRVWEQRELSKKVGIEIDTGAYSCKYVIAESPTMKKVFKLIGKVIDSSIPILLLGDTGTGKELIARTIHYNSPRKNGNLVIQDCSSLPETLLESELFGHKKGAFTGAFDNKAGLFELADKGTIFLDEIGEASPSIQIRLLRFLQEGEVKRLGELRYKKVDARVITATSRNLEDEVRAGRFREDLYYRLNVFPIKLPPLRERKDDIPLLANFFLKKFSEKHKKTSPLLLPETANLLEAYHWPGNVRELANEMEKAISLAENGNVISPKLLSKRITTSSITIPPNKENNKCLLKTKIEDIERGIITEYLRKNNMNRTRTAKELGLSRRGLIKKINKYQLTSI